MRQTSSFKGFLDFLEEGILFLDEQRIVVENNTAAERLLGRQSAGIIGHPCPTLFAGRQCAADCQRGGRCALRPEGGEERNVVDVTVRKPGGEEVFLRLWSILLPENNHRFHCAVVLRDRTREVELEKAVRDRWQLGRLMGRCPEMQELYEDILRSAASDASVLVSGESGVGKELVARALHDNSRRSKGPYVAIHCASLPETLLESELFGHARGAFSGAMAARVGRFEAAHGGSLLLDEVGELSAAMQMKLLRVLQEREIVRLGENHPRKVDVRIIAATHRDLAAMARAGQFREDLYYRLCVLPLHVPPLRAREGDIRLLASALLSEIAERSARPRIRLSSEAMLALERYSWPGNVRELHNALEYAIVHADGPLIEPGDFPPEIVRSQRASQYYRAAAAPDSEQTLIARVLADTGGNRSEAARRLGMSRTTLWKRLKPAVR